MRYDCIMELFSEIWSGMPEFETLSDDISQSKTPIHLYGLSSSQKSHLIYSLCTRLKKKCLVITLDENESGKIKSDLSFLFSQNVLEFKQKEYVFFDADAATRERETDRIKTLYGMKYSPAVVTTMRAVSEYTMDRAVFDSYFMNVKAGDTVNTDKLPEKLICMGYKRAEYVEAQGQFAIRGDIIDIYSPLNDLPYRIELFDDEADLIREFNPQTQLSQANVSEANICPVRELVYDTQTKEKLIEKLKKNLSENLHSDIEKIEQNHYISSIDKYFPLVSVDFPTLADYITNDYIVFFDEAMQIYEKNKTFVKEQNEIITDLLAKGLMPHTKKPYYADYAHILSALSKCSIVSASTLSYKFPESDVKDIISFTAKSQQSYSGNPKFLEDDIKYWKKNNYRVIITVDGKAKAANIIKTLEDAGIFVSTVKRENGLTPLGSVSVTDGRLSRGFEYPSQKTAVVTDYDIFGENQKRRSAKRSGNFKKSDAKNAIRSFEDLKCGDYVVHKFHGIGQYVGIAQLEVENVKRDYLKIKYKGSDSLYVPASQLDVLHKYIGSEAEHIKLNSLGGTQWNKTVSRVKKSVEDMAKQLIALYAARKNIKGFKFDDDNEWQKQFEEDFAYDETDDQLTCIREVKEDMQSDKCMDRLLCGDVGYGKTEVAMRAAFKCVMSSKQAAYLVPTTLLARQHYNNFKQRMERYGIEVEMMSRLRSKKQNDETLKKLENGTVDIVIGTHRILQKDIKFKSLGLLIVDEEQRFGVGHKEKLKELKNNVDVLTLTATPIPRTLNMAMTGIRDLSVITTPPVDRYPIQTFVSEYNPAVIQNAAERELARGGQVFYLYNRIESIEKKAEQLHALLPDAVIEIAHGRMSASLIEEKMLGMLNGETDILLCTTIIETGLDIPNVNTIIIENADKLGLSQLYQLRGRVGRSNKLAYAYLTYGKNAVLDEVARKRLEAIKDFTEFGSGFKIAMRDLEIRGAGNLLGREQHGNMNSVGYDMYCDLLEAAVKTLNGETVEEDFETSVDIKADAFIPKNYILSELQRVEMYKKIAGIQTEDDVSDIRDEFIDRFSDMPKSVENLIQTSYIKALAHKIGVTEVMQNGMQVRFTFGKYIKTDKLMNILSEYKGKVMFSAGEKSYLIYKCDNDILNNIKFLLQKLTKALQ